MFDGLKKKWRALKEGRPGRRFQEQYERRQESGGSGARKPLVIGAGVLIFAAGLFFLPAPGPGFLVVLLGVGLIAEESLIAARLLDRAEVRLRQLAAWGLRVWRRSGPFARALIVALGLALAGAAAWAAYWFFFLR